MTQFMLSMAGQKAKRLALAERERRRRIVRSHVLPWSVWQERLPSLRALNRQDVRAIAKAAKGVFQHATSSTSYVSAVDIYRLRQELRKQAVLKNQLFALRVELIQKTYGWLLDGNGAVRMKNEPGPSIAVESARIAATLRVFEERGVNIERALSARQLRP